LIPPFDVESFANRLFQLMNDDKLRRTVGENGKRKSQLYQIDSVGSQWKQLFDQLMEKNEV
jgi:glycosyltransferase involved in cell wall biosynthesis